MRIEMNETCSRLNEENGELTTQMSECEGLIDNLRSAIEESDGLKGAAYDAIRERIEMRVPILQAHHIVYDELRSANNVNIAKLESLPQTSAGVLDTDVSQDRINRAKAEIRKLEQLRDSQIHRLKMNPEPEGFSEGNWQYSKKAFIATLIRNYDRLIGHMEAIISNEQENIRRAYEYDNESATIYQRAQDLTNNYLDPSTASAEACIKTGSYAGTTAWVSGVGSLYNKSRKCREVEKSGLLCDEDMTEYRNAIFASKDGNIDAKSIYDDTGWFNEKLYGILCFLNQKDEGFLSDEDCKGIAQAYYNMEGGFLNSDGEWVEPNMEAVEQFFNCSYYGTGEIWTETSTRWDDDEVESKLTLEKFSKFKLLSRVSTQAEEIFNSVNKPTVGSPNYDIMMKRYNQCLAGLRIMQNINSVNTIDVAISAEIPQMTSLYKIEPHEYEHSPRFKIEKLDLGPNAGNAVGFTITSNAGAETYVDIAEAFSGYKQYTGMEIAGDRGDVLSAIKYLLEEKHWEKNQVHIEKIVLDKIIGWAQGQALGDFSALYDFTFGLGQEIDEANKTNKELLDHKNMSNYLEGLSKQECGAWDDMGFSFSGNNLFPSDSQGFNGIATGQSRDWIEAAHKAYVKSGSSETFEEWCDRTGDLDKDGKYTKNYTFIKESLDSSR